MPRLARLRLPGVPLHVLQRGHNREPCFLHDGARQLYLGLLEEFSRPLGCELHAYVLMTNHIHILMTPGDVDSATNLMRAVNQRYVQHVNRRCRRTGSLWEGRFHSSLVDSESYFFTCQRYVELNPVRAGMVSSPGDYPWSSFRANALGAPSNLLVAHALYRALGVGDEERREHYRALFQEPISELQLETIRGAIRGGLPIGSESFMREMGGEFGRRATRGKPGRPRTMPGTEQQPLRFPGE